MQRAKMKGRDEETRKILKQKIRHRFGFFFENDLFEYSFNCFSHISNLLSYQLTINSEPKQINLKKKKNSTRND